MENKNKGTRYYPLATAGSLTLALSILLLIGALATGAIFWGLPLISAASSTLPLGLGFTASVPFAISLPIGLLAGAVVSFFTSLGFKGAAKEAEFDRNAYKTAKRVEGIEFEKQQKKEAFIPQPVITTNNSPAEKNTKWQDREKSNEKLISNVAVSPA